MEIDQQQASSYKSAGNSLLLSGDPQRALGKYNKVWGCVSGLQPPEALVQNEQIGLLMAGLGKNHSAVRSLSPEEKEELNSFALTVHLNVSQCHLKLRNYPAALQASNAALAIAPGNCKALYRRGVALEALGMMNEAKEALERAIQAAPQDAQIKTILQRVRTNIQQQEEQDEKKMRQSFKNMFQ